jgi:FKBP-type peptidyl-prolyl cis-trans isomerase SlyD
MNITKNRVVSIDYTLMDERNNLIDTTSGAEPLDYLHGFENIIPGLERALEGKSRGDRFSVNIPAAEAYGERDETLIAEVPLENFRGIDGVKPGMQFHTRDSDGIRLITVIKVANNTVTVDGNHPLAGINLNFDVTVAGVREASEEELLHGHIHGQDHCGCEDGDCGGCGGAGCDTESCGGGCGR